MKKEHRYHLGVKSNVRILSLVDSFAMEASYKLTDFGANAQRPELREYLVEEQDVHLTAYADPNTYQLIEYVNKLATILNRQHICIDEQGLIKGLLNLPEIKDKWEKLKKELMQVNPIAAFEIVKQKDRELAQPVELIDNLSNAHFMHLFLYTYPFSKRTEDILSQQQWMRDRMGIGFAIPVLQTFRLSTTGEGKVVSVETILDEKKKIDKALLMKVTGQETVQLKHFTRAEFLYKETGVLLTAHMHIFEQLNEEYTTDLYLDLKRNYD